MTLKVVSFVLATTFLLFARRGNAFVPRSYEDHQSNLADKYGDAMAERSVNTRNSSGILYLLKKECLNSTK